MLWTTTAATLSAAAMKPLPTNAWFEAKERIQLDLCLVNLLRLLSWAQTESNLLSLEKTTTTTTTTTTTPSPPPEQTSAALDANAATTVAANLQKKKKQAYLESRLGAKAVLTGRIGGGATLAVYTLASLKLRDCLDDLVYYYNANNNNNDKTTTTRRDIGRIRMDALRDDLVEDLAALVEFDGLETTQDPSPRSSLTMTMYTDQKAVFVRRMLQERIVPTLLTILQQFDTERALTYLERQYPNETPTLVVGTTPGK